MSRLEKKCLIASASAHAALALLLVTAPLIWVSRKPELARPVLRMIPTRLLDGVMAGGGSPTAQDLPAPAPPAPRPLLAPAPAAPKPEPAPAKPETKPARQEAESPRKPRNQPKPTVVPNQKAITADDSSDSENGKPSRRKIEISLERDTGTARQRAAAAAASRQRAEAQAHAARAQYNARLDRVLGAIGNGLASGTAIDVPGPGGEAYADYGQWVVTVYYEAWNPPNLADDSLTVTAEVVILRNGSVESFRVIRRSGHAALDRSVERLESVRFIAKFPDGAEDDRRRFIIDFIPRSKR